MMSDNDTLSRKPSVLLVYYTYTQQALKVAEAMAEQFRKQDCSVTLAKIEFTDKRWLERFSRFPLKHPWSEVLGSWSVPSPAVPGALATLDHGPRTNDGPWTKN